MAGGMADELVSLYDALGRFREGSIRWGSVAANGVRFTLIPADQVKELLDAHQEAQEAMDAIEAAEGGKAE